MADQFRKILEQFYSKISNSPHLDVYKKILADQFDEVEVQPIHVLTLKQPPSYKDVQQPRRPIQPKRSEYLYRNSDFASVFLFGLILWALKKRQVQFLKELQDRVLDNLQVFYGQKQNQDATRYKMMFTGLFQFCNYVIVREYQIPHTERLFKAFFNNAIERKGLKKNQRQKYGTQSQIILSFMLGKGGYFPSKNQVAQPTSDAYELNGLDFCINILNINSRQQWTIGQGQNHINLTKQKNEYYISEEQIDYQNDQQQNLDDGWLKILAQSQKIKQQQAKKTPQLLTDLNIAECRSPTRSVKSPKSAIVNNMIRKPKGNNFL